MTYRPQVSTRIYAETQKGAIAKARTRLSLPNSEVVLCKPSTKQSGDVPAWQVVLSYQGTPDPLNDQA